ncbi:MAG TPA: hypothetical protein VK666_25905 [Chryseolinea sp.]|nr:hypothetical protein [Chryseolinea sp.]
MKTCGVIFIGILLIVATGCTPSDEGGILVFTQTFDFSQGQGDWQVDFTDFPTRSYDSADYELTYAYTDRPANLGSNLKSIMVSGNNHSDDLFMFMKRKISGLAPNTDYTLVFDVELASNAPKGAAGIGGAPGESVFLKAGASAVEPLAMVYGNAYTLNVDKGNQSNSGEATVVLGNIAVDYDTKSYALISRSNSGSNISPFKATSNSDGVLWLIVGTDSGFEGVTTVYYTKVNVVFSTAN